nr:translation initiation factor IF-2-like [Aegilops tauschii subsp. strangulata]
MEPSHHDQAEAITTPCIHHWSHRPETRAGQTAHLDDIFKKSAAREGVAVAGPGQKPEAELSPGAATLSAEPSPTGPPNNILPQGSSQIRRTQGRSEPATHARGCRPPPSAGSTAPGAAGAPPRRCQAEHNHPARTAAPLAAPDLRLAAPAHRRSRVSPCRSESTAAPRHPTDRRATPTRSGAAPARQMHPHASQRDAPPPPSLEPDRASPTVSSGGGEVGGGGRRGGGGVGGVPPVSPERGPSQTPMKEEPSSLPRHHVKHEPASPLRPLKEESASPRHNRGVQIGCRVKE